MWMSQFKNNPDFNIFYSDTDSAVIDSPLPKWMVGEKLGQVKLENTLGRAVYLAPKVYAFVTLDGKEVIKVKGLTKEAISEVNYKDLEQLLYHEGKLTFSQEKWFKDIYAGEINVTQIAYQLTATSTKRKPVYNTKKIFTHTEPYYYDEVEAKENK